MRIPAYQRKRARIEIIPLIDIVFFLLATFVMVSLSMIKNEGIPVNLPVAETGAPQDRKVFTTLTVTEEGFLFVDKDKINIDALPARLKQIQAEDKDPKIFIHGDQKANFGSAIKILDEVRKTGISKVAIQTAADSQGNAASADSSAKAAA